MLLFEPSVKFKKLHSVRESLNVAFMLLAYCWDEEDGFKTLASVCVTYRY